MDSAYLLGEQGNHWQRGRDAPQHYATLKPGLVILEMAALLLHCLPVLENNVRTCQGPLDFRRKAAIALPTRDDGNFQCELELSDAAGGRRLSNVACSSCAGEVLLACKRRQV